MAWALAASALLVLGPVLTAPGVCAWTMPHDTLAMVDTGYRMAHGQTPGRDFHSAFGVVFQWQMGLSYALGRTVTATLKLATLVFVLALAPFLVQLGRSRLSNLGVIAVFPAMILLGATPYAQADLINAGATFAMAYNREAWVLLTLVLAHWAPRRRAVERNAEGLGLGLLVAACLYFKLSYGLIALAWLGLSALLKPASRGACGLALLVAAAFALVLEVVYGPGFNLRYLADIALVARAGGDRISHILVNLIDARAEILGAVVLIPLVGLALGRRMAWRDLAFLAFTLGSALGVAWQNAQIDGLVTLWAAVLVSLEPLTAKPAADPAAADPGRHALVAALAYGAWAALSLTPVLLAMAQFTLGAWTHRPTAPGLTVMADVRLVSPRPERRVRGAGAVYGDEYAAQLIDGVRLLQACPADRSVATLDMFEPFTLIQGRPPNRGWAWRHFGHAFSLGVHAPAEREFAGTDCVMIPGQPTDPATTQALLQIYGPYLADHFHLAAASADWRLLVRTRD